MSSSRRRFAGAAALAAALLLSSCGGAPDRAASRPEPTAAAVAAEEEPGDADAHLPAAPPSPTDDADSQQAALDTAEAAMTAFAQPHLAAADWWAGLSPLLSPTATTAYEATDPALVPASTVTGAPLPTPAVSSYLSTVLVPTDAGEYAVLLVREGAGAPWLVERITPVESATPSAPGAEPLDEAPAPSDAEPLDDVPAPGDAGPLDDAPAPGDAGPLDEVPAADDAGPLDEVPAEPAP
ncbi:hypothetical protein [Geodermatophilus sp. CPCC 206100]|uniref:hypothetical protein n=1 Tax=Geodermatophilus sp. CPCC 206100 TaxID=3020054 RepID=UPI003AFF6B81